MRHGLYKSHILKLATCNTMVDPSNDSYLLQRIGGRNSDDSAVLEHIINHLKVLLNTRRGQALSNPDYGLEDLGDLLDGLPKTRTLLCDALRDTIVRFEPRLTQVRVTQADGDNPLMMCFQIQATVGPTAKPISLRTRVLSAHQLEIS